MINKSMYPDIKWVLNQWGEFPADFSDNACRIVSEHYFAKGEESFFEVVCRITSAIAGGGFDLGHFSTDVEAQQFASDLGGILLRQEAAFNSPVYYNLGVNEDPQCSACFIQSVEDNMEDILDLAKKEGKGGKPTRAKTAVPKRTSKRGFLRISDHSLRESTFKIPAIQKSMALAK